MLLRVNNFYRWVLLGWLTLLAGVTAPAHAQKYLTAAGVRIEQDRLGVTVQQRLLRTTTLEGIGTLGQREARFTALLEQHRPFLGRRFNYYAGGGLHVGHLKEYGAYWGADLIVGLEYKMHIFPFVLSLDFKPAVHIENHENWFDLGGAFSVRYVLVREPRKKRWQNFKEKVNGWFKPKNR